MPDKSENHNEEPGRRQGVDNSIWRGGDFPPNAREPVLFLTPLTCAAMVIVYLGIQAQGASPTWAALERWGHISPMKVLGGAYWGYITSAFVHQDLVHLVFNVYWMWILGAALERSVGPLRWLAFFVTSAWVSSGVQALTGDMGIGMSGVGYALFGFGWSARRRMPAFSEIVTQKTVQLFLVWLVFCVVMTYAHVYAVGNAAHLGGMLFGLAVGEAFVNKRRIPAMLLGLVALSALATLPLFWCPWSADWVSFQANKAMTNRDYPAAIRWYRRALDLGQQPDYVWANLAWIYGSQGRKAEYADALARLREVDSAQAKEIEEDFGKPETAPSPDSKPGR